MPIPDGWDSGIDGPVVLVHEVVGTAAPTLLAEGVKTGLQAGDTLISDKHDTIVKVITFDSDGTAEIELSHYGNWPLVTLTAWVGRLLGTTHQTRTAHYPGGACAARDFDVRVSGEMKYAEILASPHNIANPRTEWALDGTPVTATGSMTLTVTPLSPYPSEIAYPLPTTRQVEIRIQ